MASHTPASLRTHGFRAWHAGHRLIVLGAVHGDETCGTRAIERVLTELDSGALQIVRGQVTLVPVTNPLAYRRGHRAGDRNLNRNLQMHAQPQDFEDHIANALCSLLKEHEVLLDLHSFHTAGEPFAMIGPSDNSGPLEPFSKAADEEALALRLGPRRLVEGWLDTYAEGVAKRLQRSAPTERSQMLSTDASYGIGTTEYMRSQGGCPITLECGQHADPRAPEVAYRAIRNALAHLQLVDEPPPKAAGPIELLRLSEVTDRHDAGDRLSRDWASYDTVRAGDLIGTRSDGAEVRARADGFIVFPNPAALPGNEWFYFAQRSQRQLRS